MPSRPRSTTKRPKRTPEAFETVNTYRATHDEFEVERLDPNNLRAKRVRVRTPDRLAKYLRLRSITPDQHQAGDLLRALWDRAFGSRGFAKASTASLERVDGRKGVEGYQGGGDALRLRTALLEPSVAPYANLLISVCVFDEGVNCTRRLRKGLTALAVHFGIVRLSPRQSNTQLDTQRD